MIKEQIEKELYKIFRKFISEADLNILWNSAGRDLSLTGSLWNFDSIDMAYLFFEVEKSFHIHIHPALLEKYRFNTANEIIKIIDHSLMKHLESSTL